METIAWYREHSGASRLYATPRNADLSPVIPAR